jgi:hypothetical protein
VSGVATRDVETGIRAVIRTCRNRDSAPVCVRTPQRAFHPGGTQVYRNGNFAAHEPAKPWLGSTFHRSPGMARRQGSLPGRSNIAVPVGSK